MNLVPKEDAKVGAGYGDVLQKDGPVEFLNGTGVVCQNNNDYDTHFHATMCDACLLYTSPSPRDRSLPRMPSSA